MKILYASTIVAILATGICVLTTKPQLASPGFLTLIRADTPPNADTSDFAKHIAPLLVQHCQSCHGAEKQESGLRLDSREAALNGGDSGPSIIVGKSADSRLIRYVAGLDKEHVMPPEGTRLTEAEINKLRAWIDQGVKWDSNLAQAKRNEHWAYQPLATVTPPPVKNHSLARNAIDQFVLEKLESEGLTLSPAADRTTLIRRLSLDLLGLLPTLDEVDQFVHDERPEAYELLVDRFLQSPYFGERWGRHWLDMARYADSDGYEKDNPRPDAYLYRDWVIGAINADMPFDQFTIEQLAGDLLPAATESQRLATAFHRQTLTNTEGGTDQEQFRVEACFDRTETTGSVWLGLTIGCARCHTHKYDAITQREYYQLFAFFNNGDETTLTIPKSSDDVHQYEVARAEHEQKLAALKKQLVEAQQALKPEVEKWQREAQSEIGSESKLPKNIINIFSKPESERTAKDQNALLAHFSKEATTTKPMHAQIEALQKKAPPKPEIAARVLVERTSDPRATFVLRRGEFLEPVEDNPVSPSALAVLPPLSSRNGESSKADRLDLARWLVARDNPLTPRVAVNHMWRILLGEGLVRTPNDFGVRGERPTHPELLDWLAAEFAGLHANTATHAWSRKGLIKLIVMSATYCQSAKLSPELRERDPQNLLWSRQNRLRVEGEIVRDLSLDAAGLLSRKVGGPSVYPLLPPGIAELSYAGNFKWNTSAGEDLYRRGMYTFFKRTSPHPNLITFDCPDANLTCVDRNSSNTPLQALVTLNNASFAEAARGLAVRVLKHGLKVNDSERVELAFRWCLLRDPSDRERDELLDMLAASRAWYREHESDAKKIVNEGHVTSVATEETAAWIATMRVLLNLDEFITRE